MAILSGKTWEAGVDLYDDRGDGKLYMVPLNQQITIAVPKGSIVVSKKTPTPAQS